MTDLLYTLAFDHLTAVQTRQLRQWGQSRLASVCGEQRARRETAVLGVLQLVDQLMSLAPPPPDEVDEPLIRLLKNLSWLTGERVNAAQRQHLSEFSRARDAGDREQAFAALLDLLKAAGRGP